MSNRVSRVTARAPTENINFQVSPDQEQQTITTPQLPSGQMPIQEVFKMMWARMNYLEEAVKKCSEDNTSSQNTQSVSESTGTTQALETAQMHIKNLEGQILENRSTISAIVNELEQIKQAFDQIVKNFQGSMQAIASDFTEMNNKYTQMNNFLVDIQTTQITVNNKILKHYNDTCSDTIERQIEQNATEKFNIAQETENSQQVSAVNESSATEENTTASGNNVSFNIQ